MFKSTGLAKMFAGRRKFFRGPHAARGPHVRHLWSKGTTERLRFYNLKKQQIPAKYRWALSHMN